MSKPRTLVWDVSDLDNPVLHVEHIGRTAASDHNLYIKDSYVYQAHYAAGLRILDISDINNILCAATAEVVGSSSSSLMPGINTTTADVGPTPTASHHRGNADNVNQADVVDEIISIFGFPTEE